MHRAGVWTARGAQGGLTRTLLPQTPPQPLEPPGTGRGAEGDGWSAATWAGAPTSRRAGLWPAQPTPALADLGAGKTQAGPRAPSQGKKEPVHHPPPRPHSAGPAGVNHRAVCDSALAPQEAGPHAAARDGPGSQAVAGRKQEAPPSRASGFPLERALGHADLLDPPPTRLQGPPSGPHTRSAHPPCRDPIWKQCRRMAEGAAVPPRAPSWLDKHGRPARQAPGGAGVVGRRAQPGNAGRAWRLQGLALPIRALGHRCAERGETFGEQGLGGPHRRERRTTVLQSGGRLSYMASHFAIPRPPPPGAVPVPSSLQPGPGQARWSIVGHRI